MTQKKLTLKLFNAEKLTGMSRMPLSMVERGKCVKVVRISGRGHCFGKFSSMGIIPGADIKVINNSPSGPFIILVLGSHIMLGKEAAQSIIVS